MKRRSQLENNGIPESFVKPLPQQDTFSVDDNAKAAFHPALKGLKQMNYGSDVRHQMVNGDEFYRRIDDGSKKDYGKRMMSIKPMIMESNFRTKGKKSSPHDAMNLILFSWS